jgi:hypothetical protein
MEAREGLWFYHIFLVDIKIPYDKMYHRNFNPVVIDEV